MKYKIHNMKLFYYKQFFSSVKTVASYSKKDPFTQIRTACHILVQAEVRIN